MNKKVDTNSYKGVRDFYPTDWRLQKWLFWQMVEVCEKYGYENYTASILEPTNLFAAKSGEEIVANQLYSFKDKGDRDISLRPEMTPTLARMIAAKNVEIPRPIRWYSIPNLFRYEKPQKGRLREHYQLNVDIFGIEGLEAEVEIIKVGAEIMANLGATEKDYVIKINNRKIVNSLFAKFLNDKDKIYELYKLLDKREKMEDGAFVTAIQNILGNQTQEFLKLSESDLNDCEAFAEKEDVEKTRELMEELENQGVKNLVFNLTLMRGLDYYTDTVFEFFDTHPENNRSMFGGGRYDNLLEIFGGEKMPAVGFGMGDVTAREFLAIRKKLPKLPTKTDLAILPLDPRFKETADRFATELRKKGRNVEVDYTYRKLEKQIKAAERKGITKVIVVGQNEADTGKYQIKSL